MLSAHVLAWTRHIKLQTLSVEYLVVIESWRSLIETDVFAGENFVISGSALGSPFGSGVLEVILDFVDGFAYHIIHASHGLSVVL